MRFGVCFGISPAFAAAMRDAGLDYGEINIGQMMRRDEAEFETLAEEYRRIGLPIESGCVLLPGGMALNRLERDLTALDAYLQKAAGRCKRLGLQTVVFGSGGARRAPEGMRKQEMLEDLVVFLRDHAAPVFSAQGIRIAIEPLSERPCLVNTLSEAIELADAVGSESVQVLADNFHMYKENDPISGIAKANGRLIHAHICSPAARSIPAHGDGYDLYPFMKAVADAGCTRISVEAAFAPENFVREIRDAAVLLREAERRL